jgi:hypothetical protein
MKSARCRARTSEKWPGFSSARRRACLSWAIVAMSVSIEFLSIQCGRGEASEAYACWSALAPRPWDCWGRFCASPFFCDLSGGTVCMNGSGEVKEVKVQQPKGMVFCLGVQKGLARC